MDGAGSGKCGQTHELWQSFSCLPVEQGLKSVCSHARGTLGNCAFVPAHAVQFFKRDLVHKNQSLETCGFGETIVCETNEVDHKRVSPWQESRLRRR